MKKENKITLLLVVTLFISLIGYAQKDQDRQPPSKEEVKQKIEQLADKLSLTGDKRDRFVSLEMKFMKEMHEIRSQGGSRSDVDKLVQVKHTEMQTFLTKEEFEMYKAEIEKHRKNRGSKH